MVDCAAQIDSQIYDPFSANSNSVINTCLLWAGLPPVSVDSTNPLSSLWTPGGTVDLRNFNLNYRHGPDEPNPNSVERLNYYGAMLGHGGGIGIGLPAYLTTASWFSTASGHWVRVGVGEVGGPLSVGWRWVTADDTKLKPVVLDLDGDGVELANISHSPGFDFFDQGYVLATGWVTGGDGILVLDENGNGVVDDGSEISFLHHSPGSASDLQALAALDTNHNNLIDSGDARFGNFYVWVDADFDGISDSGEVLSLAAANVSSVSLTGSGGGYAVNGNDIISVTSFAKVSGGTGAAYDVAFEAYSRGSKYLSENSNWALLEFETEEVMAAAKPGASAVSISDIKSLSINSILPDGFQLTAGNDSVAVSSGSGQRSLYLDGRDGNDSIDLSNSNQSSVLKGGSGDDYLFGTSGGDYLFPGTSTYFDSAYGGDGDDYYFIEQNSYNIISDGSGMDTVILTQYDFADLNFMVIFDYSVSVSTDDGLVGIWFDNMYVPGGAPIAIDYLILGDRILTGQDIADYASQGWGF